MGIIIATINYVLACLLDTDFCIPFLFSLVFNKSLTSYCFVEVVNSWMRGTHEIHENWATTNSNDSTVIEPWAKMKISKPYCASERLPESEPRKKFGYDLRCTRSSSDKEFFGRTDRVNNNLPAMSIENAGITISVFIIFF